MAHTEVLQLGMNWSDLDSQISQRSKQVQHLSRSETLDPAQPPLYQRHKAPFNLFISHLNFFLNLQQIQWYALVIAIFTSRNDS